MNLMEHLLKFQQLLQWSRTSLEHLSYYVLLKSLMSFLQFVNQIPFMDFRCCYELILK